VGIYYHVHQLERDEHLFLEMQGSAPCFTLLLPGTYLKTDAIIQVNNDVPFIQMSELVIPGMLDYSRKMPFNPNHFPVSLHPFYRDLSEKNILMV